MQRRMNIPFAVRQMALAVALATSATQAAASLTADGRLDVLGPGGYTLGYTIGFLDQNKNFIGNGKLYFGEDASGQFLYFQMPLGFVDNTYGTNASADWTKGHTFSDLLGSDALGATKVANFQWTDAKGTNKVEIDYISDCGNAGVCSKSGYLSAGVGPEGVGGAGSNGQSWGNEGDVVSGSAANILNIATSLEYDLNNVDSTATTNSPNLALTPNWIKEVGYEIQFAPGTFSAADWADPAKAASLISLGSAHVSPPKGANFASFQPPVCEFGCSPGSGVTGVPEPGTFWLMGAALTGLGWYARRRKENRGPDALCGLVPS